MIHRIRLCRPWNTWEIKPFDRTKEEELYKRQSVRLELAAQIEDGAG